MTAADPSNGFESKHNTLGFIEMRFLKGPVYKTLPTFWVGVGVCVLTREAFVHTFLHPQFFSQVACVAINSSKG